MTTLKERLNNDLREALRAGDEPRKTVLRQLLAAIRQAEVDRRAELVAKGTSQMTDDQIQALESLSLEEPDVITVIQREAKSRRESIADAEKAGRADLAAGYQAELGIIESYLPRQLTREEIEALAREAIAEAGATSPKQLGAVMRLLAPRTKGQADGRLVNEVVRDLLNQTS